MPKLAEKFISDNGANIYDKVKITNKDQTFEGIIMPRNNFSGEHIIVIKLYNGYNIGVSTEDAEMNVIERACLLYTSPSPRDVEECRMASSA